MKYKHTNKCIIISCHKYCEGRNCGLPVVWGDSGRETSFTMKLYYYSHAMLIEEKKDKCPPPKRLERNFTTIC